MDGKDTRNHGSIATSRDLTAMCCVVNGSRYLRVIAIAGGLAGAFLTGCITLAGNQLGDLTPTAGTLTPAIEQTVGGFSFHLDGGKMITSNKMGRELNDEVLGRWEKSGFISDHRYVKSSQFSEDSQYRITLSGHQEGKSSIFGQIISGVTLMLIPYQVNSRMDLRYSLENSESGCVFEASASDSYKSVVGLLLLPIAPFAQGGRTKTFDRIANSLYDQLASRGAFEQHASCIEDTASDTGMEERLRRLEKLRTEGLISEAEYERKRAAILGEL